MAKKKKRHQKSRKDEGCLICGAPIPYDKNYCRNHRRKYKTALSKQSTYTNQKAGYKFQGVI